MNERTIEEIIDDLGAIEDGLLTDRQYSDANVVREGIDRLRRAARPRCQDLAALAVLGVFWAVVLAVAALAVFAAFSIGRG